MTKLTYNGKQYSSAKAIYQANKPAASLQAFTKRVARLKKSGLTTEHAIKNALAGTNPATEQLTCSGCHQTKSTDYFEPHQTSITGFKSRCNACGSVNKANIKQQWASVFGSKPLGNINQPIQVRLWNYQNSYTNPYRLFTYRSATPLQNCNMAALAQRYSLQPAYSYT